MSAPAKLRRWLAAIAALAVVVCAGARVDAQTTPVATVGLATGWATFGQAVPQGVASSGLQVGSLATQTDVKARWPDNSIRFAVVTANVPVSGNYPVNPATIPDGTMTPQMPTASVVMLIGGTAYTATLPAVPSTDSWLSGPLAYEGRSVVAPISSANGTAHPFLRVNFDTRVFADGGGRVDVSVENVLDTIGATTVTYDVTVSVNGQAVFTKTGVQHYYLTRWRRTFAIGSTTFAAITPDMTPFNTSKALPPYLSLVRNVVSTPTGPNYDILQGGALEANMPEHGGRAELAPYPDWTARYLVFRDLTQRAFVLANGDLSGSWPIHMREAEVGGHAGVGAERMVSINQRPNLWLDVRAQDAGWDYIRGGPLPIREYGETTPGPGQSPLIPDNAHQPSVAYVPYLMTGDRYYAEEMAFWANYAMARTYPGDGIRGSSGILEYNEVRGNGWALRNIVDAAAYYPDSSPVRAYLTQKVTNNLQWLDANVYAQDPVANPFQILWINRRPDGGQYISLWEQTYLAHAIDRANQQGFVGGLAHRNAIARFHLKLFTSEPDYPRADAGAYLIAVGPPDASTPAILGSFYTGMAQIWAATQGQERPFAGFYGPEARMNLMYGIESGWPGAQAAYDYLWPFIAQTVGFCPDGGSDTYDLACRAGWALDFSSTTAPTPAPADITNPPPGSTLTSANQIFNWNTGVGVATYRLAVGTTQGAGDIYSGAATTSLSASVSGLPTDGAAIWVRLSSYESGAWHDSDYSYTAAGTTTTEGAFAVGNVVFSDGYSTQTTAPFSTSAGDLIVAFVASSGPDQVNGETMTVTGGALTWTLVSRANDQLGVAEIWTATTPTAQSAVTVTSTPNVGTPVQSLVVVTFSGAAGTGAAAAASAPGGAPAVSLTTTRAGSLVYGVGNDWNGDVSRTPGTSQAMVHEFLNPGNDTYWVQKLTSPLSTPGLQVQLDDTAPTDHMWNFAAVEITPIRKVTPTITWATPAAVVYGTALSAAQLNATATVAGTFVYTPAIGAILNAGAAQTLSVSFTPADAANYTTAAATVAITVGKAPPIITWAAPAAVVYGTALSATQLNATATVAGTFVYTPAIGTILNAGAAQTLSVSFTPADAANYTTAAATVAITVGKAPPIITWAAPAAVVYGTALSATQLNATATVAGTFVYTPAIGAILNAGAAQTLSVSFTPADAANYSTAAATVAITVGKAPATITWAAPAAVVYGTALSATQLNATASVTGTFVYTPAIGTILNAGAAQTLSVSVTPADANYAVTSASVPMTVTPAAPVLTLTGGSFIYDGAPHPATAAATGVNGISVAGSMSVTYVPGGSAAPVEAGAYAVTATFTSGDPNYTNTSGSSALTIIGVQPFSDDPLVPGSSVVRAVHITELRTRIDALRTRYRLAAYSWTNPVITAGTFVIRAAHITQLRTALLEVYGAAARTPPVFTDPDLTAGVTMKAAHINELRAAVVAIE